MSKLFRTLLVLTILACGVVVSGAQLPNALRTGRPSTLAVNPDPPADVTAPTCAISSPTAGTTYDNGTNASMTIVVDCDEALTSGSWDNDADGVGAQACTVTSSTDLTCVVTGLVAGSSNDITVTGVDGASLSGSDALQVTYAPPSAGLSVIFQQDYNCAPYSSDNNAPLTVWSSGGFPSDADCPFTQRENANISWGAGGGSGPGPTPNGNYSKIETRAGWTGVATVPAYVQWKCHGYTANGNAGCFSSGGVWLCLTRLLSCGQPTPTPPTAVTEFNLRWYINFGAGVQNGGPCSGTTPQGPCLPAYRVFYAVGTNAYGACCGGGAYLYLGRSQWSFTIGSTLGGGCGTGPYRGWDPMFGGTTDATSTDKWFGVEMYVKGSSDGVAADGVFKLWVWEADDPNTMTLTCNRTNNTMNGLQAVGGFVFPHSGQFRTPGGTNGGTGTDVETWIAKVVAVRGSNGGQIGPYDSGRGY